MTSESTILAQLLDGEAPPPEPGEELQLLQSQEEPETDAEELPQSSARDWILQLRQLGAKYYVALDSLADLEAIGFDTEPARALLADYVQLMEENETIKSELGSLRPGPMLRERVAELTAIRQSLEPSANAILGEFLETVDLLRLDAFYRADERLAPLDQAIDKADSKVIAGLTKYDAGLREAFAARQEKQRLSSVFYRICNDIPEAGSFAEPTHRAPWGHSLRPTIPDLERVLRRRFEELRQEKPGQKLTLKDFRFPPVGWR